MSSSTRPAELCCWAFARSLLTDPSEVMSASTLDVRCSTTNISRTSFLRAETAPCLVQSPSCSTLITSQKVKIRHVGKMPLLVGGYSYQPAAAEYFHARHASVHVFQVGPQGFDAYLSRLPPTGKMEDGIQSLAKPASPRVQNFSPATPPYISGKASDMALIARFYNLNQDHIFTHL